MTSQDEENVVNSSTSQEAALQVHAGSSMNDSGTCTEIGTPLTQARSPAVRLEWTYFIRDAEGIKIGRSISPLSRMKDLQAGNGTRLELLLKVLSSRLSEGEAHRKFKHLRTHREWFRPEPELLDFIEALKAETARPVRRGRDPLVSKLHLMRRAHGATSPIGYRCSNLTKMVPIYQASTDPVQRAILATNINRMMLELKGLAARCAV